MQARHKPTEHKKSTPKAPLLELSKTFYAPVERVFGVWTNGALLREWWGPEGYECPKAEIQFVAGGKFLFCMKSETSGREFYSAGLILQIVPNEKIVMNDDDTFFTVELEAKGPYETEMKLFHEGVPARKHADCVRAWFSSFEKLRKLVEVH